MAAAPPSSPEEAEEAEVRAARWRQLAALLSNVGCYYRQFEPAVDRQVAAGMAELEKSLQVRGWKGGRRGGEWSTGWGRGRQARRQPQSKQSNAGQRPHQPALSPTPHLLTPPQHPRHRTLWRWPSGRTAATTHSGAPCLLVWLCSVFRRPPGCLLCLQSQPAGYSCAGGMLSSDAHIATALFDPSLKHHRRHRHDTLQGEQ